MKIISSDEILLHFQDLYPDKIVIFQAYLGEGFSHCYNLHILNDTDELYEHLKQYIGKNWQWATPKYYDSQELWTRKEAIADLSNDEYIDIITYKSSGYRFKFAKQTVFQELKEYLQQGTPY